MDKPDPETSVWFSPTNGELHRKIVIVWLLNLIPFFGLGVLYAAGLRALPFLFGTWILQAAYPSTFGPLTMYFPFSIIATLFVAMKYAVAKAAQDKKPSASQWADRKLDFEIAPGEPLPPAPSSFGSEHEPVSASGHRSGVLPVSRLPEYEEHDAVSRNVAWTEPESVSSSLNLGQPHNALPTLEAKVWRAEHQLRDARRSASAEASETDAQSKSVASGEMASKLFPLPAAAVTAAEPASTGAATSGPAQPAEAADYSKAAPSQNTSGFSSPAPGNSISPDTSQAPPSNGSASGDAASESELSPPSSAGHSGAEPAAPQRSGSSFESVTPERQTVGSTAAAADDSVAQTALIAGLGEIPASVSLPPIGAPLSSYVVPGFDLSTIAGFKADESAPGSDNKGKASKCPKCGADIDEQFSFCLNCLSQL